MTAHGVVWLTPMGKRAQAQARRAHDHLRPRLTLRLPAWLAHAPGWVAWADVPGPPLTDLSRLGAAARGLHALPDELPDPVPLERALARRARPLDAALADAFGDGLFRDQPRRWCHRDLHPRNAIDGDVVGLVDLEHSRPDHPLVDLVKVACLGPDALPAFLDGYGPLHDDDRERLRRLLHLHGLATLAWATRHRDATHVEEGRRALLLAGVD